MSEACKWCRGTGQVPVSTWDDPNCSVCGEPLGPGPKGMIHALCVMPSQYMQHTVSAADEIARLRAHAARLEGEVERLTRERDDNIRFQIENGRRALDAESRAARLEERLGVVRGVLKSVEYRRGDFGDPTYRVCPICGEGGAIAHSPGCALAAALGEGEK